MRPLPLLLAALAGVVCIGLGLRVMWGSSTGTAVVTERGAQYAGGLPQGHVYTGVVPIEPKDVNPLTSHDPIALRLVLPYTHDSLLDLDPVTGALRPALADEWHVAPDGLACTFVLRDGVKFADGSPLTMADVLFGWELAQAGHLPLGIIGDAFSRVQRVDVIDDRTLDVHFKDVHFAAVRVVGENWRVVQKKFFVDRVAARCEGRPPPPVDSADFAMLLHQIDTECGPGTGPYVLQNDANGTSNWRQRDQLLLVRNEHSWRRATTPGTWNFAGIRTLFRDPAGGVNAFLRGEVDWFSSPKGRELVESRPELKRVYRELVYDYDLLGVYRVVWNCRRPPFDDKRVRRALGMLFDCDALVGEFKPPGDGEGQRARRALAHAKPGSPAYPTDVDPLPFDPPAARRLLREAGFDPEQGKPLHVVLIAVVGGNEVMRRVTIRLADAAQRAGVELELHAHDTGAWIAEKTQGEWDGLLGLLSFRANGDPYDFLHTHGADNDGGWSNAEADALLVAARTELEADKRAAKWRELHALVYREQPVTLLAHPVASIMLHTRIKNVEPGPLGLIPERAWVAPQDQRQ